MGISKYMLLLGRVLMRIDFNYNITSYFIVPIVPLIAARGVTLLFIFNFTSANVWPSNWLIARRHVSLVFSRFFVDPANVPVDTDIKLPFTSPLKGKCSFSQKSCVKISVIPCWLTGVLQHKIMFTNTRFYATQFFKRIRDNRTCWGHA